MLINKRLQQGGFTIVELLITILLSLIVIGAVLGGYLAIYTSSINTLAASKLNQDLNAMMSVMVNELRRSGYSGASDSASNPLQNQFNDFGLTALAVFANKSDSTQNTILPAISPVIDGSETCVTYSYDENGDDIITTNELLGFRLDAGVVEMRTVGVIGAVSCADGTGITWEPLTDINVITVNELTFNILFSDCLNATTGVADCYATAPASGDIIVETQQVEITIEGSLTNDSFVRQRLQENVRVRNDLMRVF